MSSTLTIALTGGIGSGKSVVASLFENRNVPVIDSDKISKDIISPTGTCFSKIVEEFGEKILTKEGAINRCRLREIVFDDDIARIKLENILHPVIFKNINSEISLINYPYSIVIIPLLIETKSTRRFDRILLVDTPENLQLERVVKRDKISPELLRKIIRTQATREERLKYADDVIVNDSEIINLDNSIKILHEKYLVLSNEKHK
jgi:dephospho-CoA kinase